MAINIIEEFEANSNPNSCTYHYHITILAKGVNLVFFCKWDHKSKTRLAIHGQTTNSKIKGLFTACCEAQIKQHSTIYLHMHLLAKISNFAIWFK